MNKILIVDDETDIREMLSYNLEKEGFIVSTCSNGKEAIKYVNSNDCDLVLLDVMMPELDGIEVCRLIRNDSNQKNIIICFLTARSEDYSQIAGLEAGADDYISKPIKPRVLVSKIKSLLRRLDNEDQTQTIEGLEINREKYQVSINGDQIHLPRKEFELLALLASKPGNVFERETILKTVWGDDVVVGDRTIDVHIRKLREKVGEKLIKTVKGVGYRIEVTP
jgi:two-component system alkaline phosphatase synthesis response regulator PhoP